MAVIREGEWMDGDKVPGINELLAIVMLDIALDQHRCVFCRAEQPHDVRWPAYAFELRSKHDGTQPGDVEFRSCPACEPQLDRLLFEMGK